jgi:hypothetical protein
MPDILIDPHTLERVEERGAGFLSPVRYLA